MELTARGRFHELTASVDCRGRPRKLQSGKLGWFEVKEIQWFHGWKLRVQTAVVRRKSPEEIVEWLNEIRQTRGAPLLEVPQRDPTASDQSLDGPQESTSRRGQLLLVVEQDVVRIVFFLPDCLFMMQHAYGCCDGGYITLSKGPFWVQTRLFAKPRDMHCLLRRTGRVLEFVRTELGRETVVARMEDQLSA